MKEIYKVNKIEWDYEKYGISKRLLDSSIFIGYLKWLERVVNLGNIGFLEFGLSD